MSDHKWRVDVNDRYQKVVDLVINLATASLILPTLFLRSFLGIADGKPIIGNLNCWAYCAWSLFFCAIVLGVVYYYASAKWVKLALGQKIWLRRTVLERILDFSFWLMVLFFLAGLVCFMRFALCAS